MPCCSLRFLVVAGARPNFMKIAPLIRATCSHNASESTDGVHLEWRLVHTGQHYDENMSGIFFRELGIPAADVNLEVGSGSQAVQTAAIMNRFEPILSDYKPNWVMVVGDVTSTLACSLVAAKLGFKVAHIEAGLRSFDRSMPEEINRIVTDVLADLLFTPSEDADANLRHEGIEPAKIQRVGNIMIDSLTQNLPAARRSTILSKLGLRSQSFAYVTLHRPANVDDPTRLRTIMAELNSLSGCLPVVFPMHPRTRKMCREFQIPCEGKGAKIIDPVGYHDSLCLTENARLVLTDSGGLQEESTYFRTPCLTLRESTERPITIMIGSNRLTNTDRLAADLAAVLSGESRRGQIPPLWDGRTSERIINHLVELHLRHSCGSLLADGRDGNGR